MARPLALALLVGSLLLILCAAVHPILPLTAQADLQRIGNTPHWYWIHLGLLHATGLIIAGIWARYLRAHADERPGLVVAFVMFGIGQAMNGVNIAFMAGAGTRFAAMYAEGADVQNVYQALHGFAVMCGRLAGFLVAIAAGLIAVTTTARQKEPKPLVLLAWIACVAGLLGDFLAPPGHPLMLTSVGIMALWQSATAIRLLGGERS